MGVHGRTSGGRDVTAVARAVGTSSARAPGFAARRRCRGGRLPAREPPGCARWAQLSSPPPCSMSRRGGLRERERVQFAAFRAYVGETPAAPPAVLATEVGGALPSTRRGRDDAPARCATVAVRMTSPRRSRCRRAVGHDRQILVPHGSRWRGVFGDDHVRDVCPTGWSPGTRGEELDQRVKPRTTPSSYAERRTRSSVSAGEGPRGGSSARCRAARLARG